MRPSIPRLMLEPKCKAKFKTCRKESCIVHSKDMPALYIDDLSEAEAIELKRQLVNDPVQRPFPLNYHERTQHVLPPGSVLQHHLDRVEDFTIRNVMKINEKNLK